MNSNETHQDASSSSSSSCVTLTMTTIEDLVTTAPCRSTLVTGSRGSGKTTLAVALARAIVNGHAAAGNTVDVLAVTTCGQSYDGWLGVAADAYEAHQRRHESVTWCVCTQNDMADGLQFISTPPFPAWRPSAETCAEYPPAFCRCVVQPVLALASGVRATAWSRLPLELACLVLEAAAAGGAVAPFVKRVYVFDDVLDSIATATAHTCSLVRRALLPTWISNVDNVVVTSKTVPQKMYIPPLYEFQRICLLRMADRSCLRDVYWEYVNHNVIRRLDMLKAMCAAIWKRGNWQTLALTTTSRTTACFNVVAAGGPFQKEEDVEDDNDASGKEENDDDGEESSLSVNDVVSV